MKDEELLEKFEKIDARLKILESKVEHSEKCLRSLGLWLRSVTKELQWCEGPGRDGAPVEDICRAGESG